MVFSAPLQHRQNTLALCPSHSGEMGKQWENLLHLTIRLLGKEIALLFFFFNHKLLISPIIQVNKCIFFLECGSYPEITFNLSADSCLSLSQALLFPEKPSDVMLPLSPVHLLSWRRASGY